MNERGGVEVAADRRARLLALLRNRKPRAFKDADKVF